jgi:TRAP-type C4-dicarboxylate transport system substrate-binding protein
MAAPFGWSLWLWFKSNPLAQGVAAALGAVGVFWGWMTLRDRRIRSEARKEGQREIIEIIETKEAELKEAANEAENRITRDLNERSLRDVAARSPENLGPVRRD